MGRTKPIPSSIIEVMTPEATRMPKRADAILAADLHIQTKAPRCRKDDFVSSLLQKLAFIRDLQDRYGGIPVLLAGDMFDQHYLEKGEQWILTRIIPYIHNWVVVAGQHDLPNHNLSLYEKSTLAVLERAGNVRVLKEGENVELQGGKTLVHGFPWGVNIEGTRQKGPGVYYANHIALVHRMVYVGEPPFPGADEKGGTAADFLRKMSGYNLVVTGDNHKQFVVEKNRAALVNPGSVLRLTSDQIKHGPAVYLWRFDESNTQKPNEITRVPLPIDPEAVSREIVEHEHEHDARIASFVERLKGDVDLDLSFKKNVLVWMRENKVAEPIRDIVLEVLDG